jgi:hypothetical protein
MLNLSAPPSEYKEVLDDNGISYMRAFLAQLERGSHDRGNQYEAISQDVKQPSEYKEVLDFHARMGRIPGATGKGKNRR